MANCQHCGKPLNKAQYSDGKTYKSCPRCSEINGKEHIFFTYPNSFGDTAKRRSDNHPEGPQSWCYSHRFNKNAPITPGGIPCSEMIEGSK